MSYSERYEAGELAVVLLLEADREVERLRALAQERAEEILRFGDELERLA